MNSYLFGVVAIICFILIVSVILTFNLINFGPVYDIRASSIQENLIGMNGTSYFLPSDQSNNTTGIAYDNRISPPAGLLQIPYTGLVRNQITPEIASMLGLNGSTFGMIVSEVMP
ncbi:MAG: hypothetical protein ACRD5B_16585, partial [Nitrososphaeraceae archaeon]